MNGWLLDTNVISLLAPGKSASRPGADALAAWIREHKRRIFLSAVSVVELQAGIAKLERTGATRRADGLRTWLRSVVEFYSERLLAFDVDVAFTAGRIFDRAVATGKHPGISDIFIAATAEQHGLCIMTRNVRHFAPLQLAVPIIDPVQKLPSTPD